MRRALAGLGVAAVAAALLSACGVPAVSYNDGFAVGQSMAAARGPGALTGRAALPACRRQWRVSGPATDSRSVWIHGCVEGAHALEASVGLPAGPPGPRLSAPTPAR